MAGEAPGPQVGGDPGAVSESVAAQVAAAHLAAQEAMVRSLAAAREAVTAAHQAAEDAVAASIASFASLPTTGGGEEPQA